jgi:two-component system aerobic respiration control sensor histidine kinase ArcB
MKLFKKGYKNMRYFTQFELEQIVTEIPGYVAWLDENNIYQGCDDSYAKMLGLFSKLEVIGKKNSDFLNPEIAEILNKNNVETIKSGMTKVFDEPILTLENGVHITAVLKKKPLFDKEGYCIGLIIIYSSNKKEEKLTIQSSETFNSIMTDIPGHIYWKDKDGCYLGCNDKQAKTLGLKDSSDVVGRTDFKLPFKKGAEKIRENDLRIMKTGASEVIEEVASINGKDIIFLSEKTPFKNQEGKIIGILGVSIDITKIKNETQALQHKVEQADMSLEHIIANMPGHVYWKNKDGVYLGCNDSQAKTIGLNYGKEVIGKTDYDLPWGKEMAHICRKNDIRVMKNGVKEEIEETAVINNQEIVFLSQKSPLKDKVGKVVGILGISADITSQKKLEKELIKSKEIAEASNSAKTEFLENMRHDIRTPLSGIIGLSEVLRREEDKNKIKEYTLVLAESSKELLRFLNEVLESINVASGKIPFLKKKFDLRETLENLIKLHQPKALEKNLNLMLKVDESIPKYLVGDPVRIYRIVLELLVNSLKFTKLGHITISVKIGKKEGKDVVLQIFVEDTGPGIPVEKQQDLFVRFKKLIPSYQGIYQGSGLGLSIVKQFIEDLGGEIYVDSYLNVGTTFVCVIPLALPLLDEPFEGRNTSLSPENSTIFETTSEENPGQNIKKYVLIVEDQPIAALAAKILLEQQGCKVEVAETGEIAIKLAKENQYDFIIMDIGLPDISGYEVTKAIRTFEASHRPFITGLTGHIESEKKQHALEAGMNVFLTKPLTEEMAVNLLKMI